MYNKRDTYIKIDEKSAPKSHSVVIVGSNHLGEAKTDITMITQWKDANDGTWQSLRTPFDNIADALYYTRKYCNLLSRAANEPCLPFCAEIAGLDANGLRDKIVTYGLSECAANELPWRVRVYKNGEPQKAFADFYSLNDAVDYIAEQNNLRVSPDLAMAVSKKSGYTLQVIESQDEDIAAKGITIAEDFDKKDADGNFVRYIRPINAELTSYNPTERANYLQNLITSTEMEWGVWDITEADIEFKDYELAVWLHVNVISRESGEQKTLSTFSVWTTRHITTSFSIRSAIVMRNAKTSRSGKLKKCFLK